MEFIQTALRRLPVAFLCVLKRAIICGNIIDPHCTTHTQILRKFHLHEQRGKIDREYRGLPEKCNSPVQTREGESTTLVVAIGGWGLYLGRIHFPRISQHTPWLETKAGNPAISSQRPVIFRHRLTAVVALSTFRFFQVRIK